MTAIVIVIDNADGRISHETIRSTAQALAYRWGGEVGVAMPIVDVNIPPAIDEALAMACAANAARKALNGSRIRSAWACIKGWVR